MNPRIPLLEERVRKLRADLDDLLVAEHAPLRTSRRDWVQAVTTTRNQLAAAEAVLAYLSFSSCAQNRDLQ